MELNVYLSAYCLSVNAVCYRLTIETCASQDGTECVFVSVLSVGECCLCVIVLSLKPVRHVMELNVYLSAYSLSMNAVSYDPETGECVFFFPVVGRL